MDRTRNSRRAFTLVELLVVIIIIGILVSMLLPAVNQIREAGRQGVCKNNLRQLGIAMAAYHAKNGSLPTGSWYRTHRTSPTQSAVDESGASALHLLLPYLEQQALFGAFDFKKIIFSTPTVPGTNVSAARFVVPVYVCASDPVRGVRPDNQYALTSYVASCGPRLLGATGNDVTPCVCQNPYMGFSPKRREYTAGPFRQHNSVNKYQAVTWAMIRDGESNTIMMGEIHWGCSGHTGGWAHPDNGCGVVSTIIPINIDTCNGTDMCKIDGCKSWANWNLALGFKSAHPGGANFLMCDGSVHFFAQSIDHWLYQYLGDINDGQPAKIP